MHLHVFYSLVSGIFGRFLLVKQGQGLHGENSNISQLIGLQEHLGGGA